jgi:release factor glutamine methyltransferase
MDRLKQLFAAYITKPWLLRKLRKPTDFTFGKFNLRIEPGVFHPQYFFSSQYLAEFISKLDLKGKTFAEPCTGSGLIGIVARAAGAHVICSDINPLAVNCARQNFERNKKQFPEVGSWHVLESNVFAAYTAQKFDIITINPPYFFKAQQSADQLAWNCGKEGEFFEQFFAQLQQHIRPNSQVYMILAENCEIERIRKIAGKYCTELKQVEERKISWEKNYIFVVEQLIKIHE